MACDVKVVAHSVSEGGYEIFTLQLRYWRAIHAEFMTHRVFSRNASSSRAIPVRKVLSQVWNDPAGPIHWGSNQPGMQAGGQLHGWRLKAAKALWRLAGRAACCFAWGFIKLGLHKQVANRILEPWQYISVVVTATDWSNFFALRSHPAAQPEICELSDAMQAAMKQSTPKLVRKGEWHLPYVEFENGVLKFPGMLPLAQVFKKKTWKSITPLALCLSVARCARTSYNRHDGTPAPVWEDIALHDRMVDDMPPHRSPTEHQATPLEDGSRNKNFLGWKMYRAFIEAHEEVPA